MADSKLKLQIITALDAAGIKATQQQIDGLAKQLEKVNQSGKVDKLQNALGDMPGKLGKITKALGGAAGAAGAVVGAFTTMYEVGTLFVEKIQKKLPRGIWNDHLFAVEDLINANKKLKKQQDEEIKDWQYRSSLVMKYYQSEQDAIDKSIAKINAQAQSYNRLARAATEFFNAGEDKDIQLLERERFEDVMRLQSVGDYDAAEQANKLYDFLRQELETKKQILAYDDETAIKEAESLHRQQQSVKLLEKVDKLKEEQWTLQGWKDDLDAGLSNADIDKNQAQINARLRQIDKELQNAEKEANALADDMDASDIEMSTREVNRSTLLDRLFMEGDKLASELDNSIATKGNLLNVSFTEDYVKELNQSSIDSYNELKSISLNTEYLAEKLDSLLQMKQ